MYVDRLLNWSPGEARAPAGHAPVPPLASHVGADPPGAAGDDDRDSVRMAPGGREAPPPHEIESAALVEAADAGAGRAALASLERELAELEEMRAHYEERIAAEDAVFHELFAKLSGERQLA